MEGGALSKGGQGRPLGGGDSEAESCTKRGSLGQGHLGEGNSRYKALRGGNKGVTQKGQSQLTKGM